ncbi:uncharacterized protein LOC111044861 [Nilaparvata lugens]|uniref:uncharacterized protein LOC111044861 n=1 Tax=Nilaparvata lugens TaxID=108931 RepID=UPI00193E900A|nr:uncharacterized protein LOC111044861 [Nilaparvata lugens]
MIRRSQSDIILSNLLIETQYGKVDQSLEKCKALLKGIQREFKKTRDFWKQLKVDVDSVSTKFAESICDNLEIHSENIKDSLQDGVVESSGKCSKKAKGNNADTILKPDDYSKIASGASKITNNLKDADDLQEESIRFSKISRLDVKHLEAFLDIVQKTQVSQCATRNESSSIEDFSSEIDIFEDAVCQLSSVTSLTYDSLTNSSTDISTAVHNFQFSDKKTNFEHNDVENLSNTYLQNGVKPQTSFIEGASKLTDSKIGQIHAYINNNLSLDPKTIVLQDVGHYPEMIDTNIPISPCTYESESEEYHEARDYSHSDTIEEEKSYPVFSHNSNSKLHQIKSENTNKVELMDNKLIDVVGANSEKIFNFNGRRNEKIVKFSGNNKITYQNDSRIGSRVECNKGEIHEYRKTNSQIEKQVENRSRPRIRVTKQRKLIKMKQKDRSKTRSRSRKKSVHDMATGTSDLDLFEYFQQWPQRLSRQRDPFYSLPAKRRLFDYSTEEPSGIFHPSMIQPYNFSSARQNQAQNEVFVRKHMSLNSLLKQPFSNNELSDNGSNTTYSIRSSSDQGTLSVKNEDYPTSDDRFSIRNSTILNNSNTNIFVFRSFEDRFKPPQAPDSDKEIWFGGSNFMKPIEQLDYSGSESSKGRASSTDRRMKKKKYLAVKKQRQVADEKCNLKEIKQNDGESGTCVSKGGTSVSKVQAVISYVGNIHSDHIETPQCTQLVHETKILHSQHTLVNPTKKCSLETLRHNECLIRKQRKHQAGETDSIGKKNIDIIFNNKNKLSPDSEKLREQSREGISMRRPSSSPLTSNSKRDYKDIGIKRPSREDCRLQLVNGRGDIHLTEVHQKSLLNSLTSLNREYTVSKMDRTSTKPGLEPKVIFKISASSEDLRNDKIRSNEHLASVNTTKSISSCSGIETDAFSKIKMKKFGKKYVSCNDLMNDDSFYSKISIIPLPGDDKGLIQQVSIIGQRLWVQGATISAYNNCFTEKEEQNKDETCKAPTGLDDNRPASSSKKSVDNNEKSDKSPKINDDTVKEVTKKRPVYTPPHGRVNSKKNEPTESKPRFCPYVSKNYSIDKSNSLKPSNMNRKTPERKPQRSPKQPVKQKPEEDASKLRENRNVIGDNDQCLDAAASIQNCLNSNTAFHNNFNPNNDVYDSFNTNNYMNNAENYNAVPRGQVVTVENDGDMNRGNDSDIDDGVFKINPEAQTDIEEEVGENVKFNKKRSDVKVGERLVINSSDAAKDNKTYEIRPTSEHEESIVDNSGTRISRKIQSNSGDSSVTRRKSQQNSINVEYQKRSPSRTSRMKKRSPSKDRGSSASDVDELEDLKVIRQKLCSILPPDSSFRQILLKKLSGGDKNNRMNSEEVDIFGAPLKNSSGSNFYNDHGYPVAHISGVSLYNSKGIPMKGAYGRPLHTTLKKELAKIVDGSEERRNIFHRTNRYFEEQLLHILESVSNVRTDEFGRVYDSYGRPLFDRYGFLLYDHIGNPLTDALGRKLTDKHGVSIMGPRKKCANVVLTNLSSNESLSSHQSSDERLVKNRTELINRRKDNSKENMWKMCKRQVSFNMDPTIITLNHSDSELETSASNFKR